MFQPCSPPPLEGTPGSPPLWLEGTGLELLGPTAQAPLTELFWALAYRTHSRNIFYITDHAYCVGKCEFLTSISNQGVVAAAVNFLICVKF